MRCGMVGRRAALRRWEPRRRRRRVWPSSSGTGVVTRQRSRRRGVMRHRTAARRIRRRGARQRRRHCWVWPTSSARPADVQRRSRPLIATRWVLPVRLVLRRRSRRRGVMRCGMVGRRAALRRWEPRVGVGELVRDWGRDPAEIEAAWRDAAQDGRTADTQAGRETAAQALLGLADELREAGRRPTEIAAAYRDAVGAAREVGTPEALLAVGRSLCSGTRSHTARQPPSATGKPILLRCSARPPGTQGGHRVVDRGGGRAGPWPRTPAACVGAQRDRGAAGRGRHGISGGSCSAQRGCCCGRGRGSPQGTRAAGRGDVRTWARVRGSQGPRCGHPQGATDGNPRQRVPRGTRPRRDRRECVSHGHGCGEGSRKLCGAAHRGAGAVRSRRRVPDVATAAGRYSRSCTAMRPQQAARRVLRRASNGRRGRW